MKTALKKVVKAKEIVNCRIFPKIDCHLTTKAQ